MVRPISIWCYCHLLLHNIFDGADGSLHLAIGLAVAHSIPQMSNSKLTQLLLKTPRKFSPIISSHPVWFTPPGHHLAVKPFSGAESMLALEWGGFYPLSKAVYCHCQVSVSLLILGERASQVDAPAAARPRWTYSGSVWFSRGGSDAISLAGGTATQNLRHSGSQIGPPPDCFNSF